MVLRLGEIVPNLSPTLIANSTKQQAHEHPLPPMVM